MFLGFPARRSRNQLGSNETEQLSDDSAKEFLCMVSRKNGKYFWSSRGNKELTRNSSGAFVTFAAVDGSGYVKVFADGDGLAIDYMEHFHDKLFTFTYSGKRSLLR